MLRIAPKPERQNNMTITANSKTTEAAGAAVRPAALPAAGPWATPPWTMEERLRRIEAMGQRIHGFVEFMCKIGSMNGSCDSSKEKAVTAFYERLVIVERQLGKIQEDVQLG
jgi:hypothetical protein